MPLAVSLILILSDPTSDRAPVVSLATIVSRFSILRYTATLKTYLSCSGCWDYLAPKTKQDTGSRQIMQY